MLCLSNVLYTLFYTLNTNMIYCVCGVISCWSLLYNTGVSKVFFYINPYHYTYKLLSNANIHCNTEYTQGGN